MKAFVSQVLILVSTSFLVVCQALASSGAINGSRIEVLLTNFVSFVVVPQWVMYFLEYSILVSLMFVAADMWCPHYKKKKAKRYIKKMGLWYSISLILIGIGMIFSCFRLLIPAAVLFGVVSVVTLFVVFKQFTGCRIDKMNRRQRILWKGAISAWHSWLLILFIIVLTDSISDTHSNIAQDKYWFIAWAAVIAFTILFFYATMAIQFPASVVCAFYYTAVAIVHFKEDSGVGYTAIIAAAAPLVFTLIFAGFRSFLF